MHLRRLGVIIAAVVALTSVTAPSRAFAREDEEAAAATGEPVEATPKGAIGLGLLGAELGVVVPAIIGVDATWAYIVFPLVGAAGGAVAGHFIVDENDHAEVAVALMTAGMALVLPTLVLAVSATSYDPDDDMSDQAALGSGALRWDEGNLKLAAPGFAVLPGQSRSSGKLNVSEVNVSLVSGRF